MYWIVSPFSSKNNGISNYCLNAKELLLAKGIEAQILDNDEGLNVSSLEEKILSTISANDTIEIPDAWGLFSKKRPLNKVHARLHAPSLYLQELNGSPLNKARYHREIAAVSNADFVSSPSAANTEKYGLPEDLEVATFPNPVIFSGDVARVEKDIDIIFIGRFDKVKGADYLYNLLFLLPKDLRISIVGIDPSEAAKYNKACAHLQITFHGWIDNNEKDQLLSRAKVCAVLSRFESFSLVCFESIVHRTHVVAWHVGGIPECFPSHFVSTVELGNVIGFAATCVQHLAESQYCEQTAESFITENNEKFVAGVQAFLNGSTIESHIQTRSPSHGAPHLIRKIKADATSRFFQSPTLKVFGYSVMNEHSEQMWGSIHNLLADYKYVSRKPLGYNNKFDRSFPVDQTKYHIYDWRFETQRLAEDIKQSNPDMIFVFNGNNEHFHNAKQSISAVTNKPFVYSELGWLPQFGHIYFDADGANNNSRLCRVTLETLVGDLPEEDVTCRPFQKNKALLALQLPGDTTLAAESFPLQYSHRAFIEAVRSVVPEHIHLVVRKHPRDKNEYNVDDLPNASLDINESGEDTLNEVDAVIAVNSTFLLEALKYDVAVYHFGHGVISNKGVAIDCSSGDFLEKWTSTVVYSGTRRDIYLDYLSRRQLNVSKIYDDGLSEEFSEALYPLIESKMEHESSIVIPMTKPALEAPKKVVAKPTNAKPANSKIESLSLYEKALKFVNDKKLANSLAAQLFFKIPAVRRNATKNLFTSALKNKRFGAELDNEFKKIRNIQKFFPEKVFLYHRTKWVYFGVSKAIVNYAKSTLISTLTVAQKMDVAAMLCEAGAYANALDLVKECLKHNPSAFRKKQYLRLAHLISFETNYLSTLPFDEAQYIARLNDCFNRVNSDQPAFMAYLKKHKTNYVVIGNSPNSRGIKQGKEINTKGMVARFNSFDTALERRNDIGQKTTVWIKSPTFEEVDRKLTHEIDVVLITGTNHLDRSPSAYDFFKDFLDRPDLIIAITPSDTYRKLSNELGAPPSGGIQFLSLVKEAGGRINKRNIPGFSLTLPDALKGANGEANQKQKYAHNWVKEVEFIERRLTA
ncbi:Glycosyl transferases group 1 [compost metagenome]|uniref:glycosyltransferase family 29 protein n=1 Tax=Pseudomonas sp. JUb96 TaxID=2940539 RepID=UPI000FC33758|nr:glycosyltransferase family 29 protein [Pseudomonas sp. JUb96]MCW2270606.1 hypothetical protein [Pseudomonas sp. JUb96]